MGGAFPGGSAGEESARNAGDPGSVLGWGRFPGEGNGNPLQYSCLGNPMEEPGGLQSMGSQRIGHDLATKLPPLEKKKQYTRSQLSCQQGKVLSRLLLNHFPYHFKHQKNHIPVFLHCQ